MTYSSNYRTVYFCNIVAERIEERLKEFQDKFLSEETDLSLVKDFNTSNFSVKGYTVLFEKENCENPDIYELPLEFRIGIRKLAIRHQVPILTHEPKKKEVKIYFIPQICLG